MLTGGTLTPAYGRDYSNRAQIIKDLNEGEDFRINNHRGSTYCSVRDMDGMFQVRDASGRKLWTITVKDGKAK